MLNCIVKNICFILLQVSQLKSAIQIHNDSIQFLKRQNAELRDDLDETKVKLEQHHEYYNEMKKRNLELENEVRKGGKYSLREGIPEG
jgi:chromosome segregation ATPase